MSDLIDRQAAIEALKDMYHAAEKWREEASDDVIKARAESCMASLIEMKLKIEALPSAQPEIIRCKDCKDYQTDWETSYPNRHYCATMDLVMPEDGFCSFAERREE